jgi:hypothetical protein
MYNGNGQAGHKICGVFDGFSHWSWKGMKQWLAYFKKQTGAKEVIIYEAQFIPASWLKSVGVPIPDKKNWGIKPNFETLPAFCNDDADCTSSGPNYRCTDGVCIDQCLSTPPPCESDDSVCTSWAIGLKCPGSAYCNKKSKGGNGFCHYSAPKPNACKKVCHDDSDCPNSYCNKNPNQKDGCCHDVNPGPSPGPPGSCNADIKNCEKCVKDPKYCSTCNSGWCLDSQGKSCTVPGPCPPKQVESFCDSNLSEEITDVLGDSPPNYYCRFNDGTSDNKCDKPPSKEVLSKFLSTYGPVGSIWQNGAQCAGNSSNNSCVIGTKGGEASAVCPYGMYFNGTTCVSHSNSTTPAAPVEEDLPIITLTWYGFVGLAKTNKDVAIDYINTVMKFCNAAGIQKLTFPFIIPDKNGTPFMISDSKGGLLPLKERPKAAAMWIQKHVLNNSNRGSLEIGLVVYANYKNSNWECFMQGNSCDPGTKPSGNPECDSTGQYGQACAWPHVASFLTGETKGTGDIATGVNLLSSGVTFLQVDKEECNCGTLTNTSNCKSASDCVVSILKNFGVNIPLTVPVGLGDSADAGGKYVPVPEVYWDGGNQFPCDGSERTYAFGTPVCTDWSAHRRFRDNPQGFYDNMVGNPAVIGSDTIIAGNTNENLKNNYWLGRNKFQAMMENIKNSNRQSGATMIPSFSIENLSMCSGKMKLVGNDPTKGGGHWECSK